jgi:uncharacterized protein YqgV (UPF0045/DUF77 family)
LSLSQLRYAARQGEGVGEIVAEAVRVVRESGLPNRTDAMFTNILCLAHC